MPPCGARATRSATEAAVERRSVPTAPGHGRRRRRSRRRAADRATALGRRRLSAAPRAVRRRRRQRDERAPSTRVAGAPRRSSRRVRQAAPSRTATCAPIGLEARATAASLTCAVGRSAAEQSSVRRSCSRRATSAVDGERAVRAGVAGDGPSSCALAAAPTRAVARSHSSAGAEQGSRTLTRTPLRAHWQPSSRVRLTPRPSTRSTTPA